MPTAEEKAAKKAEKEARKAAKAKAKADAKAAKLKAKEEKKAAKLKLKADKKEAKKLGITYEEYKKREDRKILVAKNKAIAAEKKS